jgi:hypothetical protein
MELGLISPRPLAEAALLLEGRFDCMVTYEDAPYLYADDMVRDEGGRIIPRGGRISVQYQVGDDLREVIHRVLGVHARSGYPGLFAVEARAGTYHIVPYGFRNADGVMEERLSLLDTMISLPSQVRSGLQLVESIALAVSEATGESISLGTLPINAFIQHVSAAKVLSGKSRDLLIDLFCEMAPRLSWQLLNDPGKAEFYLNIHRLPDVGA